MPSRLADLLCRSTVLNRRCTKVATGTDYTGTWTFTGNSNAVDLLCSSNTTGNCDTVTLNITTTGDSNTYDLDIGESAAADSSTVSFTLDGDNNVVTSAVNGTSTALTVTMDNSASLATTSTNSDEGNAVTTTQSGNGDSQGNTIILDITGGGSTYNITQDGVNDNMFNGTFDGDSQDVDISQDD